MLIVTGLPSTSHDASLHICFRRQGGPYTNIPADVRYGQIMPHAPQRGARTVNFVVQRNAKPRRQRPKQLKRRIFPAGTPCLDCGAQRNTLGSAGLDMDGLSNTKKENFLSKLCNQIA
jgi:hypothetical protein